MAPNIERQTEEILQCLFAADEPCEFRAGGYETDGPGDDDTFDAVIVAEKLKEVADKFNQDAELRSALRQLQQTVAQQAMEKAFSDSVEFLQKATMTQSADMAPELHLIRTTMALGLYIKKEAPGLMQSVQGAMASFLNSRVGRWVADQGGWEAVADA